MAPYIDIHSHDKVDFNTKHIKLNNLLLHESATTGNALYSAGWHPWHINNYSIADIKKIINQHADNEKIVAIGECGFDRNINTPIEIQQKVFELHIEAAKKQNKALIIHCVKAHSDLMEYLNKNNLPPVIIHRYSGNCLQTEQYLKYHNVYFSMGAELLRPNGRPSEIIKLIPPDKLFLETDDSDISIEKIYIRTAEILNLTIEALKEQIANNFKIIFGDGVVKQN